MESREAILSADASNDSRFDMSQSIVDFRIRSLMCVPLLSSDGTALGVIQVDTLDQRARFQNDDLEVLASVASQAAVAVENAQLHDLALQQQAMERDLELAHKVQQGLLPLAAPKISGYEFFDFYEPAYQVGGDYFDYVELPGGRFGVILADVSGKGVAAALLMAKLSGEMRYALASEATPAAAVQRVNAAFSHSRWEDRFVTLVLVIVDPQDHKLTVVNAGHMPPLVRRADGRVEELGASIAGVPMGVDSTFTYEQTCADLITGDLVVMFTDGISEAMNGKGELYGIERLRKRLEAPSAGVAQYARNLLDDVKRFVGDRDQNDDICLTCFVRLG
jgi:serine phosphatase RsbU (regulator of sigma subunit)